MRGLDLSGIHSAEVSGGGAHGWEPPEIGEVARLFPGYDVLRLLGRGELGAVWQARQSALDRVVAIKLLPLEVSVDKIFAKRFSREAQAMARLNHPHIVAVYDSGSTAEGHLFLVMEYVEGARLREVIHQVELDPEQALSLAGQVGAALAYAHGKGVIHRDIQPANIMVDGESHVKVTNFGLARLTEPGSATAGFTVTGMIMGTSDYMAPEQKSGRPVDHRADLYALGVTLYEMLCRHLPEGSFAPPSQSIGCDARIDEIVRRAMRRQPELRYQTACAMNADVETARLPRPEPAVVPRGDAPAKSKTGSFVAIAALLAILAAGALFRDRPWSLGSRLSAISPEKSDAIAPAQTEPNLALPAVATPVAAPVQQMSAEDAVKRLTKQKGWEDLGLTSIPDGTISVRLEDREITDLSPLADLPVSELYAQRIPTTDLSPLRGLPLRQLWLDGTLVEDLAPLKELPIVTLGLSHTPVSDLSPLRDLKLQRLILDGITKEIDLAPLAGMTTLEDLVLPEHPKNLELLRQLPNLKFISNKWGGVAWEGSTNPAAEFWKAYDDSQPKPLSATGKWLAAQEPQWQAGFTTEVSASFKKAADDLKKQYRTALDGRLITATRDGQLDVAVAVRAELQSLADGGEIPTEDEAAVPAALKTLRAAYRKALAPLETGRLAKAKIVHERYDAILAQNQTLLTQRDRLDEAREIKAKREQLAAAWLEPLMSATAQAKLANGLKLGGSRLSPSAEPWRDGMQELLAAKRAGIKADPQGLVIQGAVDVIQFASGDQANGAVRASVRGLKGSPLRLVVRESPEGFYEVFCEQDQIRIQRINRKLPPDESWKELRRVSLPRVLVIGSDVEIELRVVGNALTVKVNGKEVASVKDATWKTGRLGISSFSPGAKDETLVRAVEYLSLPD